MIAAPLPECETERLRALRRCAVLDTAAEPLYDDLTAMAARISAAPVALITLIDESRQWFKSRVGVTLRETPRDIAICAHTILCDDILVIEDGHHDERFRDNPLAARTGLRFYAGVPLVTAQGYAIGTLCVFDTRPRQLDATQIDLLKLLAGHAARLLDRRADGIRDAQAHAERERLVRFHAGVADESRRLLRSAEDARRAMLDVLQAQQEAEARLRESEAMHRRLFARSPLPMLVHARDTLELLAVNEVFCRHYGHGRDEVLAMRLPDLHPPAEREAVRAWAAGLQGLGDPQEWTHLRADGTAITVEVRSHDIAYLGRESRLAVLVDVTRAREAARQILGFNADLERRVAERTAALAAANRELATFTYSVSHDLKAPLRGIDGYARLLQQQADQLDDDGRLFLDRVREGVARMGQLIADLLAYCHVEQRASRAVATALEPVVEAVTTAALGREGAGGVRFDVDLSAVAGRHPRVDPEALAMALRNLVDNAIKFGRPADGGETRIEIRAVPGGAGSVILSVRDHGIGFDMTYHDRIFEIFQRLERVEDYPGTGVGLAIVRKAIQRMGGRVWAESVPGQGAVFHLELPA
ncbi:MAG: hypothetical protein RL456_2219 [Pseudomonadota bacterium]|jgi:PAS domain S-box-containing protein